MRPAELSTEVAVDVNAVTKIFGVETDQSVTALDQVSVSINQNEFFTLLGPSGCGKTTLLRLVAGFDHPLRVQSCLMAMTSALFLHISDL